MSILANMVGLKGNRTVFISVHAVDGTGNHGEGSNIVSLSPAHETSVPRSGRTGGDSMKTYLAVILPLALASFVFLLIGIAVLTMRARKSKTEIIEQVDANTLASGHSCVDLHHMNYMFEGGYRKRMQEEADTWSRGSIW